MSESPQSAGFILGDAVYTKEEVIRRLRLGDHALETARRQGLKSRYIGRRAYFWGKDIIEFIAGRGERPE